MELRRLSNLVPDSLQPLSYAAQFPDGGTAGQISAGRVAEHLVLTGYYRDGTAAELELDEADAG